MIVIALTVEVSPFFGRDCFRIFFKYEEKVEGERKRHNSLLTRQGATFN